MNTLPIVVDLDGTLIYADVLHESILRILYGNPFNILRICYWLLQGKAVLKQQLAKLTKLNWSALPYNQHLLTWLQAEKDKGHQLILCTASDISIAEAVFAHLNIFDEIMASDGKINLSGKKKAAALTQRFGQGGFDYVGNSFKDLAIWQKARRVIIVNASSKLIKKVKSQYPVEKIFPKQKITYSTWGRVLRVHQWLKNLLLFLPLFAAHQLIKPHDWAVLVLAFFSFSLCASAIYILNDLFDLESDRQHIRKRNRPFASGQIEAWKGMMLVPLLLVSFVCASFINKPFFLCLLFYLILTSAYSFRFKRFILIDSIILAVLYTVRIISGNVAINLPLSYWLLAFSIFLFLSLAFVKRYAELQLQHLSGKEKIHGRGYHTTDAPLIQMFGISAGYVSALVLALYMNSETVIKLYRAPYFVWGTVPITLFWISWIWLKAHRGNMHDDPVIFAVKDKISLLMGALFALTLIIGTVGLSW